MSIGHRLDSFSRDLRFGFRQLRKNPAFTVTAILTLALGVGANTVVFGVLNAVLLRPLPFRDANRLVSIFSIKDGIQIGPSPLDARDFSQQSRTFEKLAVFDQWRKNVITSGSAAEPENQIVGLTSSDFFQALGIHPILGRMFTDEEATVGHNHVALITESFWKTHYARSQAILGRTLIINSDTYTIVGVLPDTIPSWMNTTHLPIGIWEPFLPTPDIWSENGRGGRNYGTVGLLKPDVTIQQARSDLARIAANLAATYPVDTGIGVTVEPLIRVRAGNLRPQLFLLMGAVTLILLIACSNLASLLLARNSARQREFATRAALGAGRNVLIRQILVETLLISWIGGGCGITLAWLINMMIRQQHPAGMPQLAELTLDWRVFLFTFLISTLTNLLFGIAPAILHTRINLVESLKDGGRNSGDRSRQSFRQVLVTAQVALSLMLMVGASLLVETIVRLQSQDFGFPVDHLLKAHFFLPGMQYPTPEAITRFCDAYAANLRSLPGVRDASITTVYPPRENWRVMFSIPGKPVIRPEDLQSTLFGVVDSHFLGTAGIPIIRGREFSESDTQTSPVVTIVNQTFANRYFGKEDPVGRPIVLGPPPNLAVQDTWLGNQDIQATVIGVMRDTKNQGLASGIEPQILTLFRQMPVVNYGFKDVMVRSAIAPDAMKTALEQQLHSLDPRLPLSEISSMAEYIETMTSDRRFTGTILTSFATLGVLLAVIGIYGVISYLVVQRTQEMGIRLALGAMRFDVLWLIVRQGLLLALAGVGIGLLGIALLSRSLSSLLYGVSPLDAITLAGASFVLLLIATMASAIPGRRAMRIDPVRALRTE